MIRALTLAVVGFLMVGCSPDEMVHKIATPDGEARTQKYIDQLRQHEFSDIKSSLDPSIAEQLHGDTLERMAALIPAGSPTSIKLVGANRFSSETVGTSLNITYEYQFGDTFVLANVATKTRNGVTTIIGFHVEPLSTSLEVRNRFSLAGKTALQYGVLAAAIVVALFTLGVLIVCIRTKLKGRKWPWVLFILFGFGKLSVDWFTGKWAISVLTAQLFSASATAGYFSSWIVSVSLPVGAVVFLLKRRRLVLASEPSAV